MQSLEEISEFVGQLRDRDQIWQCLQRYARGVDRFDAAMIGSVFHPDAVEDHGKFVGGPEEFIKWVTTQHTQAHLGHMHNLFNHYCDLQGDTAHTETYFMFAGMNREGTPLVLNGGRYLDRFEKRDGEWKIAFRTLTRDWGLMDERPVPGEPSSFTSTRDYLSQEVKDFMNHSPSSSRDRADISYTRPLKLAAGRLEAWRSLVGRIARS